jgi:hypothetical protein
MKRALNTLLLITLLAFVIAAQSEFDEPKWARFEPVGEEFSVDFPSAAVEAIKQNPARPGPGGYHGMQNRTFFAIFSSDKIDDAFLNLILGLAESAPEPKDIEIDSFKGRRYDFKGSDGYQHSLIAVQAPVNCYIFHVISETPNDPMIGQFLSSIKLDRLVTKSANSSVSARSSILKEPVTGGAVSGGPVGGGFGAREYDVVAPPKNARVDSSITILSKPLASYTTLARRYQISGTVRLRVSFEKNREIGAITVISKLPLGLTQSAISAARGIKFSPAVRKGEPYTVSKVVDYNFTIY